MRASRTLLMGGAGFLGAWIARRLFARGEALRVFDVAGETPFFRELLGETEVEWRSGDVADALAVLKAAEGCEHIVYLAGLLTPQCRADPVRGAGVNLIGMLNAFEAALKLGVRRLVYASSAGVFGPDDSETPRPVTHYGAFKLACEGSARAYWRDHGLASIGFRPFVVYGPGRETGLTAGPSLACRAAARGEPYVIPYRGRAGLVFVGDVAAAFERALDREPDGAHVFNLVGEVASNEDVIAAIRRVAPNAKLAAHGPDVGIAAGVSEGDLRRVFPDLPTTSLEDGVARTISFYREAEAARWS